MSVQRVRMAGSRGAGLMALVSKVYGVPCEDGEDGEDKFHLHVCARACARGMTVWSCFQQFKMLYQSFGFYPPHPPHPHNQRKKGIGFIGLWGLPSSLSSSH